MTEVPTRINAAWIGTLSDTDLLAMETELHNRFEDIERAEKRLRGAKYDLVRGSEELINAWDRWSRVNNATRVRNLAPRRVGHRE
jgi:hypothetical protein